MHPAKLSIEAKVPSVILQRANKVWRIKHPGKMYGASYKAMDPCVWYPPQISFCTGRRQRAFFIAIAISIYGYAMSSGSNLSKIKVGRLWGFPSLLRQVKVSMRLYYLNVIPMTQNNFSMSKLM